MAIDGDPGAKGLGGKTGAFEQASYKNFPIDLGIDFHRPTHEYTPFEDQVIVSAADIHLTMTNPRIFDRKFHIHHLTLRRDSEDLLQTQSSLMPGTRTTASDIDPEQGRDADSCRKDPRRSKCRLGHGPEAYASSQDVNAPLCAPVTASPDFGARGPKRHDNPEARASADAGTNRQLMSKHFCGATRNPQS
jgi:hypothetical protein